MKQTIQNCTDLAVHCNNILYFQYFTVGRKKLGLTKNRIFEISKQNILVNSKACRYSN
jgi:hypothetical protein